MDKCACCVPETSRDGTGPDERIQTIEQVVGGLPALGAAYGGMYESVLGPFSVAAEPARKRVEKACVMAAKCGAYAKAGHAMSTRQVACSLNQKVVARALQYDVRILEID